MHKYFHLCELLCIFYVVRAVTGENCSEISVLPSGKYQSSKFIYAVGIPEIEFIIQYNCSTNETYTVSWRTITRTAIPNSNITLQGNTYTSSDADGQALNGISDVVTLTAPVIETSMVDIGIGQVEKTINITIKYCESLNGKRKTEYEFLDTKIVDCSIQASCNQGAIETGQKIITCGASGEWTNGTCRKDEYQLDISFGSNFGGDLFNVPVGARAIFNCVHYQNYSVKSENVTFENVSYSHHKQKIRCVWTEDKTSRTDLTSNASSFPSREQTRYVTLNVRSLPTFREKSKKFLDDGSEMLLKISFWANPPTQRSNLTIYHNGNETDNYYFKQGEISHDILFYYKNVSDENFGDYTMKVLGVDEFCMQRTANITTLFENGGHSLHMGYVISIVLGGVLLIVFIIIVVIFIVSRTRRSKDVPVTPRISNSNSTTKFSSDAPTRSQNRYNQEPERHKPSVPPPLPSTQYRSSNSQFDTDDDEFEPDDYEPMESSERPPMPLPSASRDEHFQQRQPHSAVPSIPLSSTLPRGLPPARIVAPPLPTQSRGLPQRRDVAPPPPRSRIAAPPPPSARGSYVNNRRQNNHPQNYEYAGQEYEESDFQQDSYEVPVTNYRY